ncbi:mandelate racemase/muconate lactonizing enzyme family protein [Roseomonas sp. CCTCC AB2023176]|uniref:mandelate racemase/muconate lactonizing enzyme family protein n=1 Tax=Roseomonas sp. CCTCC AB2023176 TaxID=3342640 RepID=UPI0035D535EF
MSDAVPIRSVEPIVLRIPFRDGGSGMGITPNRWDTLDIVLVRVEAEDGLVGWGEAFGYVCWRAVAAAVADMVGPLAVGRAIADVQAFNLEAQRRLHLFGRHGITIFALSGLDIALWDLAAKRRGVGLASLITDAPRVRLPAYTSLVRYGDPALVARFAGQAAREGFGHVKLHEITRETIAPGRDAMGSGPRLMVDVNGAWNEAEAAAMIPFLRDVDTLWLEEPVFPPDDFAALARLGRAGLAISAGENVTTAHDFARVLDAVTYAQPSVTKIGGVSEFLSVLRDAAARGRTLMPHSPYFGPGYWATLHLTATLPEGALIEHLYVEPEASCGVDAPWPEGGVLRLPEGVGIGFSPDPAVVERYRVL